MTTIDDGRITTKAAYGQHIGLTCANHPDLSWSTKNIGRGNEDGTGVHIARSIYANTSECSCSASLLRVHPNLMADADVPA